MKHLIFLSQFDPNFTTNTEEKKQTNKTKHYNHLYNSKFSYQF